MAEMPPANPIPDKPPLHLRGGFLAVVPPVDLIEACLATPAVRALRNGRPNATMAVVTPESTAALWDFVPGINKVIVHPDKASAARIASLVKESGIDFESTIAWEASRAASAFKALRIRQRLGYKLKGLSSSLTDPVETPDSPPGPATHRVRYYTHLLDRLHVKTLIPENFSPPPLPDRPGPPRLAVAPGSETGPAYRWPLDRFRQTVNGLLESHKSLEAMVVGFAAKDSAAHELAENLGKAAIPGPEQPDLRKLLESLANCSVVLCNDGEVAHLAAHLGIPAAVLFGPGDPESHRPLGRIHRILDAHVECSPCGLAKCPLDHRCMEEITVDLALEAVESLLSDSPGA